MTYKEWMNEVDLIIVKAVGLHQDDLPDWLSRDAYEAGLSAEQGAEACLESAGFYPDIDYNEDDGEALASAGLGTDEDYFLFDEA